VVSVEVLLQIFFDASIEVGLDGMRAAPGHLDDFSVSDDQFTILEYIVRFGKHLLAVGVIGIHRNVSSCAGAQMSAVMQAQQAGSTGTRENRDLVQAVFAVNGRQRTHGLGIEVELGKGV